MLAALQQLTRGAGSHQFLFVDRSSLQASVDLLSLEWISGKGELVTLKD